MNLIAMNYSASAHWNVEVVTNGRSGSVVYHETTESISFYWEFGGGDTIAIIWVEDLAVWRTRYPWAVKRRQEIIERVAHEVIRQKASTCRAEFDDHSGYIYIRDKATQL